MTKNVYTIRRIVREETVIKAITLKDAVAIAENVPADKWECYGCEYWSDD